MFVLFLMFGFVRALVLVSVLVVPFLNLTVDVILTVLEVDFFISKTGISV